MVYGLCALFPGTTALLTPSSARRVGVLANLTPASGRQNHTASPSATRSARLTLRCVHRIPPHVRDDRDTPLLARRDGESKSHVSEKRKSNIFRGRGGQQFANTARRANQLGTKSENRLRRSAFRTPPASYLRYDVSLPRETYHPRRQRLMGICSLRRSAFHATELRKCSDDAPYRRHGSAHALRGLARKRVMARPRSA